GVATNSVHVAFSERFAVDRGGDVLLELGRRLHVRNGGSDALVGPHRLEYRLVFVPFPRLLELLPGVAEASFGTLGFHRNQPYASLVCGIDGLVELLVAIVARAVSKHLRS